MHRLMMGRTILAMAIGMAGMTVAGSSFGVPFDPVAPAAERTAVGGPPAFDGFFDADLYAESESGLDAIAPGSRRSVATTATGAEHIGYSSELSLGNVLAIPEPDTAVLFGLGVILLGVAGRRR
jgi:hypothetical protein